MRRIGVLLIIGIVAVAGCRNPLKSDTYVPLVEEFQAPPDEERFNNPEERAWKPPAPKKEFRPGFGGPGGPGSGGPSGGPPGAMNR